MSPLLGKKGNRDNHQKPPILYVCDIQHPHFKRYYPGFHILLKCNQYKCHSEGPIQKY